MLQWCDNGKKLFKERDERSPCCFRHRWFCFIQK